MALINYLLTQGAVKNKEGTLTYIDTNHESFDVYE